MRRALPIALLLGGCAIRPSFTEQAIDSATVGTGLPQGFLLGAATAAHQVEGGNNNDWTAWEQGSYPDGRPHIANSDVSGLAADSWNRFDTDLQLLRQLGANSYRFSVEWARIEPTKGTFDTAVLTEYRRWATELRNNGIEPMVTLYHFTLPTWVSAQGGWLEPATQADFEAYVEQVAIALGDKVDLWCTINEPNVYSIQSYLKGLWPPGLTDQKQSAEALAALIEAHARAATALKAADLADADGDGHATMIGLAHHVRIFQPATDSLLDNAIAGLTDDFFNESVVNAHRTGHIRLFVPGSVDIDREVPGLKGSFDYLGINYYTRDFVRADLSDPSLSKQYTPDFRPKNDLGWDLYPEGLYLFLKRFSALNIPIVITENGMADNATGDRRGKYLKAHLYAVERAVAEGVNVKGYLHWSLLDNFEWADGWTPKFGLFHVDLSTFARTPSDAVPMYREIATNAGLSPL